MSVLMRSMILMQKTNIFVGDVFYQDVFSTVQAVTPVPGGIGTITTASLLKNVVEAGNV